MGTYSRFSLHRGQYEDQSLASLVVEHKTGFDSVREAMRDFRGALAEHYHLENKPRECCVKTRETVQDAAFCFSCGTNLSYDEESEGEYIAGHFLHLFECTLDTASQRDFYQVFEKHGWRLGEHALNVDVVVCNVERWCDWMDGEPYGGSMHWECADGTEGRDPD